jgi:hypothetical protein
MSEIVDDPKPVDLLFATLGLLLLVLGIVLVVATSDSAPAHLPVTLVHQHGSYLVVGQG